MRLEHLSQTSAAEVKFRLPRCLDVELGEGGGGSVASWRGEGGRGRGIRKSKVSIASVPGVLTSHTLSPKHEFPNPKPLSQPPNQIR